MRLRRVANKKGEKMGTRGAYGFRLNGKDKVTYNHFDSYMDGLGRAVLNFIRGTATKELRQIAKRIKLVSKDKPATMKQVEDCIEMSDTTVNNGKLTDWYVLLRKAQGNPNVYKDGLKYMINGAKFLADSLFCEWAYIINLDKEVLEIYVGFNKDPSAKGRYACIRNKNDVYEYHGVRLLAELKLSDIREMSEKDIEAYCKATDRLL